MIRCEPWINSAQAHPSTSRLCRRGLFRYQTPDLLLSCSLSCLVPSIQPALIPSPPSTSLHISLSSPLLSSNLSHPPSAHPEIPTAPCPCRLLAAVPALTLSAQRLTKRLNLSTAETSHHLTLCTNPDLATLSRNSKAFSPPY